LTSIVVVPGNPNYASADGVLFNAGMTDLFDFPEGKAGGYTIPSSVTAIGDPDIIFFTGGGAFSGCSSLTSVTIPNSVTSIGRGTFFGCCSLATVSISDSVTSIGFEAFSGCTDLTSVFMGSGVTHIAGSSSIPGNWESFSPAAFSGCGSLTTVIFLGDAPELSNLESVFADAGPAFSIYYLSCSAGFTSPTWNGYPAVEIDEAFYPAASWLAGHNLPYDTDLYQDLNNDGVSLLTAYALNLNPDLNLQSSLPKPVLGDGTLGISFHGEAAGITYTVETSQDLRTWTAEGVVVTEPDEAGQRMATVSQDSPKGFLRLLVGE
jgi:hypothetical protein